jgi:hypothetical protein
LERSDIGETLTHEPIHANRGETTGDAFASGLRHIDTSTQRPDGIAPDSYWLAKTAYAAASALGDLKRGDQRGAREELQRAINDYTRSMCVEPGEREILLRTAQR